MPFHLLVTPPGPRRLLRSCALPSDRAALHQRRRDDASRAVAHLLLDEDSCPGVLARPGAAAQLLRSAAGGGGEGGAEPSEAQDLLRAALLHASARRGTLPVAGAPTAADVSEAVRALADFPADDREGAQAAEPALLFAARALSEWLAALQRRGGSARAGADGSDGGDAAAYLALAGAGDGSERALLAALDASGSVANGLVSRIVELVRASLSPGKTDKAVTSLPHTNTHVYCVCFRSPSRPLSADYLPSRSSGPRPWGTTSAEDPPSASWGRRTPP